MASLFYRNGLVIFKLILKDICSIVGQRSRRVNKRIERRKTFDRSRLPKH